ncbi:MAG TPA: alpha/beta hydrolase [Phenylobacterium sp.]|jgi:pimeloyl-ACP methyl ester carboxylesterase|uniref:alpha/beta fold hydrolase n=1 Tax=Phenylobacterium sp. TaxID=1871053 RepID=UPI002D6DE415|nr:alpha/beta hydrolase [Phenylobacterium sp.]HZZ69085.1 alpha/beta hydrolase [Phenylobacterium sp.]
MTSVQQGTLRASGASIFYRSCGRGTPVLILAGGAADADATDPLRDALAERFRVITYDRRGLSRSRIDPGASAPSVATHAEDAHLLLATLTDEPAYVFGTSLGGLIGLELLTEHPEQVRALVVHEAPTRQLLPQAERDALAAGQQAMLDAFHWEGVAAALQVSAELSGLDPEDREPDIASSPMGPAEQANLTFLFGSDAPQIMAYQLDIPAIDVQAGKITPAAGRSTGRSLLHRCAEALSDMLERPLAEFPGGHTGWLLRPQAFATRLVETFAQAERRDWRLGDGLGPRHGGRL